MAPPPLLDMRAPDLAILTPPDKAPDTGPPGTNLSAGLVAWWKFDEPAGATVAADSSGNGNDGTLFNLNVGKSWEPGKVGGAIHVVDCVMANRGCGVLVKRSASLDGMATAFSMTAWVKKNVARGGEYRTIASRQLSAAEDLFSLGFFDGRLMFKADRLATVRSPGDPLPLLPDYGAVAVTYDGGTLRLYLAGAEIATMAKAGGNIAPGDSQIVIGGNQNGSAAAGNIVETMDGYIDELRFYNRALNPLEIKALAQ
jgi:hypothetical protein